MDITIRPLEPREEPVVQHMLWLAIFVPEGAEPLPEGILDEPPLDAYHRGWGRRGDIALVAIRDEAVVGAAWCRLFPREAPGFGFVDDVTPELGMAIEPPYRGRGIGTRLIEALALEAGRQGFGALSLSVDKQNRAAALYQRLGFETVDDKGTDLVMRLAMGADHDSPWDDR